MFARRFVVLGAFGLGMICATAGKSAADDVGAARTSTFAAASMFSDLITATSQLECLTIDAAPGVCSYHVKGTPKSLAGAPRDSIGGTLANGQLVVAGELQSVGNGRGHVFLALVWTRVAGHMRFVGYIPAIEGSDISVAIGSGDLIVTQSIYGPNDMDCCPGHTRIDRDTLDGVRLRTLSTTTVPSSVWPGTQFAVPEKL